ncbi:hypothetical protein [Peptoniphilus stercorisuis]|uniref:Membrane protein YkgB n=1 Tax=Peptoniphilus stercorisuis TaxID=1436965 RepID=A0ABS4KA37_9FIRM|nr:hypothetical protein [Peptoniphilus stercorisuis]MBP2024642.1 putative membrane protein YkgB [Peptoniphilus stercorisuis]
MKNKKEISSNEKDLDITEKLNNLYMSDENDKEDIKKEVYNNMKNKKKNNGVKVAAIAGVLLVSVSANTFAGEFFTKVKEIVIPSERISVVEEKQNIDPSEMVEKIPEDAIGQVFDKDGNILKEIKYGEKTYNKKGELITGSALDGQSGKTTYYSDNDSDAMVEKYNNLDKYLNTLAFKPLLLNSKYTFVEAEGFKNDENIKSEYATFIYENNKNEKIVLSERISTPENAYETGGENIKEININGIDIIYSKGSIDFESNGLLVSIMKKGASEKELIEIYNNLELNK